MRQLASNEIQMISGGYSDAAVLFTVAIGVAVLAIAVSVNQPYSTYEVITPLYDSNGLYTGYDKVDTYVVPCY